MLKELQFVVFIFLFPFSGNSQTNVVYDFENLTIGAAISVQDNWFSQHSFSTVNNGNVCPPAAGTAVNPNIIATTGSGSYLASKGLQMTGNNGNQHGFCSRKNDVNWATPNLSGAVSIVIEADFIGNWWGKSFRLAYDSNNDGNYSATCTTPDANELSFGFGTSTNNAYVFGANGAIVGNVTRPNDIASWTRFRLCIDLTANNGQGAGSLFYKDHASNGNWIATGIAGVNMGLNTAAANQTNYQNINGIVYDQEAGGYSTLDNISISVYHPSATVNYGSCNSTFAINLFDLFSPTFPNNGSWTGPSLLTGGHLGSFDPAINVGGIYEYQYNTPCGSVSSFVNVFSPAILDLGNDTIICNGSSVILDAGSGYDTYNWSNGASTQTITVNAAGTYSVNVESLLGNLVVNGDFEGGTTAATNNFTTDYISGTGGAWGLLSNSGEYAISTSPSLTHANFGFCTDHTTGMGNMFVANGSGTPNTVVWRQTVNVTTNTEYLFSFWVTNVLNTAEISSLQLYINGMPISGINNTSVFSCNWQQMFGSWNSGVSTTAILEIINQNVLASGNDFALDDITFNPVCNNTDSINVNVETPIQSVAIIQPTCVGGTDGQIIIDNSLATEYSIDGGTTWVIDSFFVSLPVGNYTVCSKSALGCSICENVVILNPPPVVVSSNDTVVCENAIIVIIASATGGTIFGYHWDFTTDTTASQTVLPIITSTYTVYATNEGGCQSAPIDVTITVLPPISALINPNQTICLGNDAIITAEANGGIGTTYTFTWSNGTTGTGTSNSIIVSPTDTTVYSVTVSDGCESTPITISSIVNVAPLPIPSFTIDEPIQCEPAIFTLTNTTDISMMGGVFWLIDGQYTYLNENVIETPPFYAGSYDVQMIVTSAFGCIYSITFTDTLEVLPLPIASFTYNPSPVLMFNAQINTINSSQNATSYEWYADEGAPGTSVLENPIFQFPDGVTGEYEIMLIASNEMGCVDTAIRIIPVLPEVIIYAPNTFTPDDDEFNQTWQVIMEGIDIYHFEITIYNRWGELIWESRDLEKGWDGTYKGLLVQSGTYTWVLQAKDKLNDGKYDFNGHVTVLR